MRARRTWSVLVLLATIGLAAACSASDDQDRESASSTSTSTSTSTSPSPSPEGLPSGSPTDEPATASVPPPAGPSAAAAVAVLPAGAGSGPVTITYDGLGQADSTFVGQCSHAGSATTLSGTAGSATVDLVFDNSGATLTVTDVGLGTSQAALAGVDLTVADGRLTLAAPLVSAGDVVGSVSLDVTCGS